jgi:hypothetical protein
MKNAASTSSLPPTPELSYLPIFFIKIPRAKPQSRKVF